LHDNDKGALSGCRLAYEQVDLYYFRYWEAKKEVPIRFN